MGCYRGAGGGGRESEGKSVVEGMERAWVRFWKERGESLNCIGVFYQDWIGFSRSISGANKLYGIACEALYHEQFRNLMES